ncbi:MAG: Long-chain fatty acid transport protein [Candidatus Electronema aureum]|uniref:Long-chain fatty acid transport protein n=1 Tax=Candidatus Electronema aureum TaxID=2005002 RepID=A0A521G3J2_9BACT|nr:MAG: Long-chain fatty acid transport protein [Candidatus Electronema aureum]
MLNFAKKSTVLTVWAASLCLCGTAWSNPHGLSSSGHWALHLPFDLEPSEIGGGARALGMGNAFVAVADDVRAATVNPAGLSALQQLELAADLSYSSYEMEYMDTQAAVNNIGVGPALDEISTFDDTVTGLSFAGAAIPIIPDRFTAALYYRSSAVEANDSQNSGPQSVFSSLNVRQQNISEKSIDEYLKNSYGAAAAFKYSKMLSFGAGVSLETLNADMREMWTTNNFNGSTPYSSLSYGGRIEGDDTDFGFNLGVMVTPISGVSTGLSYRTGSSFSIDYTSMDMDCDSLGHCQNGEEKSQAAFDTPDIWSAGASWQPAADWLLSAQADWVGYSALADSTTTGITLDEDIDDEVILRFGAEKTFAMVNDMNYQLRAGLFHIPDHDGFAALDSDRMHYTLGGGMTWKKQIKVDLGTSFSEDTFNSVLSLTYSL